MKLITLALIACVLTTSLVVAEDATCANHPAFLLATKLIKRVVQGNQTGQVIVEKFLQDFKNTTPSVKTAEELGVCSDYAGQKTCCSSQLASFLDKASVASVMGVQKKGTPVHKLAGLIQKVLLKGSCAPGLVGKTIKDILDNTSLTNLRSLVKAADDCKLDFAKAISALTRGSMCSICVGVEKISDYIDNGKLKVSESSLAAFKTASEDAITCLKTAVNTEASLTTAITEVIDFYNDDSACDASTQTTMITSIKDIFLNHPIAPKDASNNDKCSGKVLFNEANTCATAMDGDGGIETEGDGYTPPPNNARLLADTEDAVSSVTGVNGYITSNSDNSINNDGSWSVSYDTFVAETTDSSVSRLQFIAGFMALLSLFAF